MPGASACGTPQSTCRTSLKCNLFTAHMGKLRLREETGSPSRSGVRQTTEASRSFPAPGRTWSANMGMRGSRLAVWNLESFIPNPCMVVLNLESAVCLWGTAASVGQQGGLYPLPPSPPRRSTVAVCTGGGGEGHDCHASLRASHRGFLWGHPELVGTLLFTGS